MLIPGNWQDFMKRHINWFWNPANSQVSTSD